MKNSIKLSFFSILIAGILILSACSSKIQVSEDQLKAYNNPETNIVQEGMHNPIAGTEKGNSAPEFTIKTIRYISRPYFCCCFHLLQTLPITTASAKASDDNFGPTAAFSADTTTSTLITRSTILLLIAFSVC